MRNRARQSSQRAGQAIFRRSHAPRLPLGEALLVGDALLALAHLPRLARLAARRRVLVHQLAFALQPLRTVASSSSEHHASCALPIFYLI